MRGVDRLAGQQQLGGAAGAHEAGQERGLDDGRQSHPDFGETERRLRHGEAQVTGQRQLEPRAETVPVDAGQDGKRGVVHTADRGVERRDQRLGPRHVQVVEHVHVHPGGERPAATGEDGDTHGGVGGQPREGGAERVDELEIEEIERRPIEGAPRHGTRPLDQDGSAHQYRRMPGSIVRAQKSRPPARFRTSVKPRLRRYSATAALRTPWWQ